MSVTLSSVRTLSRLVKPAQSNFASLIICQPQINSKKFDRQFSSAYVSKGFVDQNVKKNVNVNVKKTSKNLHESATSEKFPEIKEWESKLIIREPETPRNKAPLVLLFGWGGASHKNLGKYADIYLKTGCTTAQYCLSTRLLFRDTAQIPELMTNILRQLEKVGIYDRQVYVHCLSDTGVMCYQGMLVSNKNSSMMKRINIRGVVFDSCPGPRPEITVSRVAALLVVNWMCSLRDKMSMSESLYSSYRLLLDRAWPGLLGKWKGEEVALSLVDGKWAGHWGRDHYKLHPSVSELFLYSNTDFYVSSKYLEQIVLAPRDNDGSQYKSFKFTGSKHVAHLRKHKKEYVKQVQSFIQMDVKESNSKTQLVESMSTSLSAP